MSKKVSRVYVVDDDPSVRRALAHLFTSVKILAETYASATEFLAARGGSVTGCLVLDVRMHGMTGLDLQSELRIRKSTPPIIFAGQRHR